MHSGEQQVDYLHPKGITAEKDHLVAEAYDKDGLWNLTKGGKVDCPSVPKAGVSDDGSICLSANTVDGRQAAVQQSEYGMEDARRSAITSANEAEFADKLYDAAKIVGPYMASQYYLTSPYVMDKETMQQSLDADWTKTPEQEKAIKFLLDNFDTDAAKKLRGGSDTFEVNDETQARLDQMGRNAQHDQIALSAAAKEQSDDRDALKPSDPVLEAGTIRKGEGPDQVAARLFEQMYGTKPKTREDMAQVRNIGRALVAAMNHEGKVFKVGEGLTEDNFQDFLRNLETTAA